MKNDDTVTAAHYLNASVDNRLGGRHAFALNCHAALSSETLVAHNVWRSNAVALTKYIN